ncbi:pentatricopeptide repeat-containing protein At2g29760, chloroplastic-like [Cicer arietinum]|uniref:Pentatricopeptide repeat-containing protein At3g11460, mitochondrial n=1 Tax=Cicer arietinum TaxID=3827 RepID=A0A1S2XXM2_CICAR|nr:putative pentatricopeptide repeat-containing protein At3g11460, mitochondrial [Cicer arietinum]
MIMRRTFPLTTSRYYTSATLFLTPQNLLHLLQLSIDLHAHKLTQQCHSQILANGFAQNAFLTTRLISAYATCGDLTKSRFVFDSIEAKNVYLWNSLINGYVKDHQFEQAIALFREMDRCDDDSLLPDDYTLATMSKVSGELEDLVFGKMIHGKSVRVGVVSDIVVANSVMSMYCKCGEFGDAMKVFDEMPQRNVGSFNVIMSGCASLGNSGSTLHGDLWNFFRRMQCEGYKADAFTIASLLPVCCGNAGKLDYGRELHCYLVKNGLDLKKGSDVHMGSSLIDMYSRSNKLVLSRRVFDQMKSRNIYVWTAMINGCVQNGAPEDALIILREMQRKDRIPPNKVSLISVLPACGLLAGLTAGKQVHAFSIKMELNDYISLCNALIDMYAKCGSLVYARRVFDNSSYFKDAITWSSMISAYGLHGKGEEAVTTYYKMLQQGIKPDMITVVGVLSSCSKSGLVDEGISIYKSLTTKYEMKPTVEICACVVDMLGRSGQLDQALEFIKEMPIDPGPSVWGSLLTASVIHGNSTTRDMAYKCLLELEPENPSNYISLSNTYASYRRWDVVTEVRTMMKERGLRKVPGISSITISGKTHSFSVADTTHPSSSSIYEMLDDLVSIMTDGCTDIDTLT